MQAHRMRVTVPEDHRATIDFPETIRSGPVELIVLVPSKDETPEETGELRALSSPPIPKGAPAEGRGRMAALVAELGQDPRPFRELSPEERSARLERVMGVGRGLMSTSEEFARQKVEEIGSGMLSRLPFGASRP